jgi:hypothetical protein
MTRHTIRLHLMVREENVGEVSTALRTILGERVVGLVPQEDHPGLWAASGQWPPDEAAALLAACAGLPVRVTRGVLLGVSEEPPDEPGQERVTVREAFEAWSRDEASEAPSTTEKEGVHR